ncbi:hypothetical protein GBAR_LOCUS10723, partial [Geodia barretti]
QNILAIVYGPISTYTCPPRAHTHLQSSTREFAHTRFHDFRVIIFFIFFFFFFFFFFKPAISLPVPVQAVIFSLKVSNFAGGVHGHQAIVSFLPLVTTVDHGALPWSTRTTPFAAYSASV